MRFFFDRILYCLQREYMVFSDLYRCSRSAVDYFAGSVFAYQCCLQYFHCQRHESRFSCRYRLHCPDDNRPFLSVNCLGCLITRHFSAGFFSVLARAHKRHMLIKHIPDFNVRRFCLIVRVADLVRNLVVDLHRPQKSISAVFPLKLILAAVYFLLFLMRRILLVRDRSAIQRLVYYRAVCLVGILRFRISVYPDFCHPVCICISFTVVSRQFFIRVIVEFIIRSPCKYCSCRKRDVLFWSSSFLCTDTIQF